MIFEELDIVFIESLTYIIHWTYIYGHKGGFYQKCNSRVIHKSCISKVGHIMSYMYDLQKVVHTYCHIDATIVTQTIFTFMNSRIC